MEHLDSKQEVVCFRKIQQVFKIFKDTHSVLDFINLNFKTHELKWSCGKGFAQYSCVVILYYVNLLSIGWVSLLQLLLFFSILLFVNFVTTVL